MMKQPDESELIWTTATRCSAAHQRLLLTSYRYSITGCSARPWYDL